MNYPEGTERERVSLLILSLSGQIAQHTYEIRELEKRIKTQKELLEFYIKEAEGKE